MREPDRIVRLKTVLARTGLSRSTIYRKIAEARSRLSSKSAPTGPAGMNPTSTAGSPIPPRGVRNASSIRSSEVGRCQPLTGPSAGMSFC
jgi:prophage regulatory protein